MSTAYTQTEIVFLMNPATGSVATLEEWRADFGSMSAEEWGGERFEDAGLIEVVKGERGGWIEKK